MVHPSTLDRLSCSHDVRMMFACYHRLPAWWPPTSAAPNRLWPSWCSRNWLSVLARNQGHGQTKAMAKWKLNLHFEKIRKEHDSSICYCSFNHWIVFNHIQSFSWTGFALPVSLIEMVDVIRRWCHCSNACRTDLIHGAHGIWLVSHDLETRSLQLVVLVHHFCQTTSNWSSVSNWISSDFWLQGRIHTLLHDYT